MKKITKENFYFYRNKRNDIEARLLELEAEIELRKAYSAMPAGHGRFNFDELYVKPLFAYDIIL